MKGDAQLFNMVMEKYRMSDTLTAGEQAYMLESRKRVLKSLLRKYGKYTPLFWLVILLATAFRGLGVKLTFIQAKAILAAALVTGTAGASAVTYAGAKYIYEHMRQRDVPEVREVISLESPAWLKGLPEPRPAATEYPDKKAEITGEVPPRSRVTVPSM